MTSPWTIGKRYGHHLTEIVHTDGRTVYVRTHEGVHAKGRPAPDSYEPTPEGAALLAELCDALNEVARTEQSTESHSEGGTGR